jgi:hypothetical protein
MGGASKSSPSRGVASVASVAAVAALQQVQTQLEDLLRKELDGALVSPSSSSRNHFRVAYLSAMSRLRPTFWEDDEDFLDKDMREAEWDKRQRYNQLKKVWIRYDRMAPDKARDLSTEDQEIENDLDLVEEEIQEEWHEFAEELLDILDFDQEDDENFGDEEDMNDLAQWKGEMKQMQRDASLLKRRILERTMQRRAREEEERAKVVVSSERKREQMDLRKNLAKAASEEARLVKSGQKRRSKRDSQSANSPGLEVDRRQECPPISPKHSEKKSAALRGPNCKTVAVKTSNKRAQGDVSAMRLRFSQPTTPQLPAYPPPLSPTKYKYGRTGVQAAPTPIAPSFTGCSKHKDDKAETQKGKGDDRAPIASVRGILKILELHERVSAKELAKALNDLCEAAVRDNVGCCQTLSAGKGNETLYNILRQYQSNATVLEVCLRALELLLVRCEKSRDALASLGAIEIVLVGMLFHQDSVEVQERGCHVLTSFATTRKYQDWIVGSKGIEVLLTTQAAFVLDANVQAACFQTLTQIAMDNRLMTRQIAAEGAIKALMEVICMPEHETNLKFHRVALRSIAVLARDDDANRGTIAKNSGIYLTLLAMECFGSDGDLQQYGCEALCSLAMEHPQNRDSIHNQGGLSILSKTMKDHRDHLGALEGALPLLTQLTETSIVSRLFGEVGGVDRVLVAMRNFETSVIIHEHGCLTLCNMAIEEENKETIRNLGGIRMIVSAMRLLGSNTFVQKSGCRALDSLATNDQSKVTIAASGGVSAMLSAMQAHASVGGVQGLAIAALRKLATIHRNRGIMKMNHGIESVEGAMQKYPKHAHLQENGRALVKLLDPTRAFLTV